MLKLASTAALLALTTTVAIAQAPQRPAGSAAATLSSIPANSATVTHWHKQNVYDPSDNKIGEVNDVLIDRNGKAAALIIGVGGFLGIALPLVPRVGLGAAALLLVAVACWVVAGIRRVDPVRQPSAV